MKKKEEDKKNDPFIQKTAFVSTLKPQEPVKKNVSIEFFRPKEEVKEKVTAEEVKATEGPNTVAVTKPQPEEEKKV